MKVLILHQHFKTPHAGGAIRSYYLAKALQERGINTIVISGHNGGAEQKNIDNIAVHYVNVPYDNSFGFGGRIASFLAFAVKAVRTARRHRDTDLVYAISTPLTTGLAARAIRKLYRIPYIFEVGDLWPDAPVQMGFIKHPLLKRALYRMEKRIYKDSSAIVALSDSIREEVMKKISGRTVHVVPNMSDTEFFEPEEKQSELERKFDLTGKLVVSYIGAFGLANGLHYILDCAAACQHQNLRVHFILCGEGAMLQELKRYANELRLINTTFVPFQNRVGVREILNVTDVNFVSYLPVKILETGSPNKYFDGLAAGKVTAANFSGWVRDEIEREQCGIFVDPNDAGDFVKKIRSFLDDGQLLQHYKRAARSLAEKKYSRNTLSNAFAEICENIGGAART